MFNLAKELMNKGKNDDAIKKFNEFINLDNINLDEKAEAYIFLGDLTGDVEFYHKSFLVNSNRRHSLIKMARYFIDKQDYQKGICYLKAALEIKFSEKYSADVDDYNNIPLWLLYYAYWYNGDQINSKIYFDKCIENIEDFDNIDNRYLNDYKFYYDLPKISIIGKTKIMISYPGDKVEHITKGEIFRGEYIIKTEYIKHENTLMIEYLKKINGKKSLLLTREEYQDELILESSIDDSEYKIIYIKR